MDTTRTPAPSTTLAILLTAELAAIVALHHLGDLAWARIDVTSLGVWLATTSSEDVILATARLAGLACAYWLLVTSLASSTVAAFRNTPPVIRALAKAAPKAIRTLTEKTVVSAVAGGAVLVSLPGLSAAAPSPPGVTPPGVVAPPTVSPRPIGEGVSASSVSSEYVVVAGDNLWSIAAATVADRAGIGHSRADVSEIAAYWLRLVEANRDALRSGDPDLIFPGERIVLPD